MRHNYTVWKIMCPICNVKDDTLYFWGKRSTASRLPSLFPSAFRKWALRLREEGLTQWWFSSSPTHLAKRENEPCWERLSEWLLQYKCSVPAYSSRLSHTFPRTQWLLWRKSAAPLLHCPQPSSFRSRGRLLCWQTRLPTEYSACQHNLP